MYLTAVTSDSHLSSIQAAKITGISLRQLQHWDARGVVTPSGAAAGSGSRRGYREDDLLALTVARELRGLATGLGGIQTVIGYMCAQRLGADCDKRTCLFWTGSQVYHSVGPDADTPQAIRDQTLIRIPLGRLAEDLRARLPQRPRRSETFLIVENRSYRVTLVEHDEHVVARCPGVPRSAVTAASVAQALAMLEERLKSPSPPRVRRPRGQQPVAAPAEGARRPSRGAAAWGESW